MTPAIVIMAYNRPGSLQRLLVSLSKARYPRNVNIPLVFSIDKSDNAEVRDIAEGFEWPYGGKEIIAHEKRLGLMGNFLFSGGLSQRFGSIIFLEDDFYVSPAFYSYTQQALGFYEEADDVALLPLYALQLNGFTHQSFRPIVDGSDVFFAQVGWFKGLAVSAKQWTTFTEWLANKAEEPNNNIPRLWHQLGDEEWYPLFSSYLVETQRYFVFPRTSLVTDFSDAGMHFGQDIDLYQTNLLLEPKDFAFTSLDKSMAVYDAFLELLLERINRLNSSLAEIDYSVDLNASKQVQQISTEYILTTRPAHKAIQSFSTRMTPIEANVMHNIAGEGISLAKTSELRWDRRAEWRIQLGRYRKQTQTGISLRGHIKLWVLARLDDLGLLG